MTAENATTKTTWNLDEERRLLALQYAININSVGGLPTCVETVLEDASTILDFLAGE